MKNRISFGNVFWPSLIAGILLCIIFFFVFTGAVGALVVSVYDSAQPKQKVVKKNSILHIQLGKVKEISDAHLDVSRMGVTRDIGLADILYGLKKAAKDDNIKGIFLELDGTHCGYTTASDIRNALLQFENQSGKFVMAYYGGEAVSQKDYYIGSVANKIYGLHASMFEFVGLGGELWFYKGLFDKLDLKMHIIRGPNNIYKSAVEPYYRKEMSDSSRYQMQVYINNIWGTIKTRIGKSRDIAPEMLDEIADSVLVTNVDDAVRYHLVDAALYKDQFLDTLREKVGLSNKEDLHLVDFEKYAREQFEIQQNRAYSEDANIAVIIAQGGIAREGDGIASERLVKRIRKAKKDSTIQAIVLRVNSPGGSALASEEIWRAVKLANKEKPVIVSMGDVAASGGYYITTAASKVFAEKTTITGSIGVFGVIPYTGEMLTNKLGITFDRVETNPHAVLSTNRKLSPFELKTIQEGVDKTYHQFLQRVADGRDMTVEAVDKIARGHVWTGGDALKIGLVDTLGRLSDAISYAVDKVNIKDPLIRYYPRVETKPWMSLVELFNQEMKVKKSPLTEKARNILIQLEKISKRTGIQMRMAYPIIK